VGAATNGIRGQRRKMRGISLLHSKEEKEEKDEEGEAGSRTGEGIHREKVLAYPGSRMEGGG